MRRLLSLLFLLAVGAVAGAPYFVGMQMQDLYAGYMNRTVAPGALGLKSTQFSRGWFKSTARDTFVVSGPGCEATGCQTLVVDTVIHHGPIAVTGLIDGSAPLRPLRAVIISRLDLTPLMPAGSIDPALPPLQNTTIVELDGSAGSRLSMAPSQHTVKGKEGPGRLALGGIDGQFRTGAGSSSVRGSMDLASLSLQFENGKGTDIKAAGLDVDGTVEDTGFLGKLTERVDHVTTSDPPAQPFEMQGFAFVLESRPDGNAFDVSAKSVSTLGRNYGPLAVSGQVTGLNRAALKQMQAELQGVQAQQKPPLEAMTASMQVYQQHLPDLLKSNPELNIKTVSIKSADGEIAGSLRLGAGMPVAAGEPGGMVQMLKADFSLQIPAVTLWNIIDAQKQEAAHKQAALSGSPFVMPSQDEIGAEITKLVHANMLVPLLDANAYVMQGSLHDGRFTLNGQELGDWNTAMGMLTAPPVAAAEPAAPEPVAPAPKKRRR